VTLTQFSEHYQNVCQAIRCLMLSLLIMFKLKSMCWGLISLNLHTIPCLLLVYYSAYFVVEPNSLANHSLSHIIFWPKLCLFYMALVFIKACSISCLLDIHKHFIRLLEKLISRDDVFSCINVWPRAKVFLCLWHVHKAWAKNAIKKIPIVKDWTKLLFALG